MERQNIIEIIEAAAFIVAMMFAMYPQLHKISPEDRREHWVEILGQFICEDIFEGK